ncbi:MAG TPA: hypothetical protein VNA87_01680 [Actinomycetota bacterium]|nr:hypothetical protein [Actinomycetota bacterium]
MILGVEVPAPLMTKWRRWLAPRLQPFFVSTLAFDLPTSAQGEMTPELRDTFRAYSVDRDLQTVWLSEQMFVDLNRKTRAQLVRAQVNHGRGAVPVVRRWEELLDPAVLRAQADGHRFVWWPSLFVNDLGAVLDRVVSEDRLPSRHAEVHETCWERCAELLPGARALAGTFPSRSGPNCFGTVMAASGLAKAADAWMLAAPFENWLDETTRRGGDDDSPGTVLVWRDHNGGARHAAVTIGDGWGLEKPSQDWHSPRGVSAVQDLIRSNRIRGWRLQRRQLIRA